MRIMFLAYVAAMAVAASGSRAGEPAMDDGHTTDTLRKSDTELWIPKIIRDDLRAKATDFVTRVFPNVDQEWLRAELDKGLGPNTYIDIRGASRQRPQIRVGELPLLHISLPDARHMALFPSGTSGRYTVPPGVVVDKPDDPITLDNAEVRAREVLGTVIADPGRARRFTVRRSGTAQDNYHFFDFREADSDALRWLATNVSVEIGTNDGAIRTVRLWRAYQPPRIAYDEALTIAEESGFRQSLGRRLYFGVHYRACIAHPLWKYFVPPQPGAGPEDETWWDANTGELLYSHVLRGGTEREPYRNPAFFVEVTDELVMRNVEKMLLDRATELKRQAKERPDANKP